MATQERILEEIAAAGGWISFARYMQRTLHEPGIGYYASGAQKFGARGDFVTAPELGKLFGRTLARQLRPFERVLEFGALRIMTEDRSVGWRGQPCVLSNTEYKLLLVLAEASGRVLSRDELLKKMRGIEFDGLDRSIDNCISKLRRKFDDTQGDKIKTVWGEGYLFSPSAWG